MGTRCHQTCTLSVKCPPFYFEGLIWFTAFTSLTSHTYDQTALTLWFPLKRRYGANSNLPRTHNLRPEERCGQKFLSCRCIQLMHLACHRMPASRRLLICQTPSLHQLFAVFLPTCHVGLHRCQLSRCFVHLEYTISLNLVSVLSAFQFQTTLQVLCAY